MELLGAIWASTTSSFSLRKTLNKNGILDREMVFHCIEKYFELENE